MAWNEPGSNDSDPNKKSNNKDYPDNYEKKKNMGKNDNQNGPPDLDQIFNNIAQKIWSFFKIKNKLGNGKFNNLNYFNNGSNVIVTLILFIILLIYLLIGFYIVQPAERAVITRFGKYSRTVGPGPHWIPKFIENSIIVNSEQVGFSRHNGSMLTKDENIIFVEIEIQFRILDVNNYLFKVSEPIKTLKQAVDSALRQVVGHSNLDFIMTEGRAQISDEIKQQVSYILDQYSAGIQVIAVAFKEAKAPEAVKSAFDDVIKAREEKERLKHAAEAFANKIVPEAEGNAQKMLVDAEAYKREIIAKATGDVVRFNSILFEYNKSPEITRRRIYIEALEEVLANTSKIIVDVKNGSSNLFYLPLDKLIKMNNEKIVDAGQ